jgi:hypothetical protein
MTSARSRTLVRLMLGVSLAAAVMTPRTANAGEVAASRIERPATAQVAAAAAAPQRGTVLVAASIAR